MPHTELFPFFHIFGGRYLDPEIPVWAAEALFWALALALSLLLLRTNSWIFERMESAWRRAGRHKVAAMIAPGLLVIVIRVGLLPVMPVPTPAIHDEFSYLFGAETFAAGRLTNPTPAAASHLETFHINVRPTYHSMYPPALFLFPALGLLLAKNAWVGVLLGVALMCSAVTWMLQQWLPSHWALLGGVWAALRFGVFSYWVNSYWGGAMAALAGALVLGACARVVRHGKTRDAVVLALGLFLLANTRPVEGLLFSLPVIILLVVRLARLDPAARRNMTRRVLAPALLLLMMGAGWMLYYDARTTGSALVMPYMVNHGEYHISRPYLWQTRNPIPAYRHQSMRGFYVFHELPDYVDSRSTWGLRQLLERNLAIFYFFFVFPLSFVMLSGFVHLLRDRRRRVLALSALAATVPLIVALWPPHGHYAAPAVGAFLAISLTGLRRLRTLKIRGARFGLALSRAVVILMTCMLLAATLSKALNPFELRFDGSGSAIPLSIERARIASFLDRAEGLHLVIVHYRPNDIPSQEWIANHPDLGNAKVIWARDMGAEANRQLLREYPGRHVWYCDRLDPLRQLQPYESQSSAPVVVAGAVSTEVKDGPQAAATSVGSGNSPGFAVGSGAAMLKTRKRANE